jgi:hypothetical protein
VGVIPEKPRFRLSPQRSDVAPHTGDGQTVCFAAIVTRAL